MTLPFQNTDGAELVIQGGKELVYRRQFIIYEENGIVMFDSHGAIGEENEMPVAIVDDRVVFGSKYTADNLLAIAERITPSNQNALRVFLNGLRQQVTENKSLDDEAFYKKINVIVTLSGG